MRICFLILILILILFFFQSVASAAPSCKFVFQRLRLVETVSIRDYSYRQPPTHAYLDRASFEHIREQDRLWLAYLSFLLDHPNFRSDLLSIRIEGKRTKGLLPSLLLDFPKAPVTAAEIYRRWSLIQAEFLKRDINTVPARKEIFEIEDYVDWINELGVVQAAEVLTALEKIGFVNIYFGTASPALINKIYPLDFSATASIESRAFRKILMYYMTSDFTGRELIKPNSETGWNLAHHYARQKDLPSLLTLERMWPGSSTEKNYLGYKPSNELTLLQSLVLAIQVEGIPRTNPEDPSHLVALYAIAALQEREFNFPSEMKGEAMVDSRTFRLRFRHLAPVR